MTGRFGCVAVVPARAGSKRVPGKNVRTFGGQPLVVWSINAALASTAIDRVVVSTDDDRVASAVSGRPVDVFDRPGELATDVASTDDVLREVDARLGGATSGPELIVLLQATSPLRAAGRIAEGVARMRRHPEAARLVEVTSQSLFSGTVKDGWWCPAFPEETRSQDLPQVWYPTGGLYIYRPEHWFDHPADREARSLALELPVERCVNIDHEYDFVWADVVYQRFKQDYSYLAPPSYCPA